MGTVTSLMAASATNEELLSRSAVYSLSGCFESTLGDVRLGTTCAICSGRSAGSGVKSRALTPLKIVVLPRMPIASVSTATIAKPGARIERPHGVPQVLTQRGEEREAALVAMGFDRLRHAAELGAAPRDAPPRASCPGARTRPAASAMCASISARSSRSRLASPPKRPRRRARKIRRAVTIARPES